MSAPTKTKPATKAAEGTEEDSAGAGKKKVVVMVVALLAVGAAVWFFLFSGGDAEAEAAPVAGVVLPLDSVAVNLAGSGYLKIGVTLQLTDEAGEEPIDGAKATDIVIDAFSGAQLADVAGNREALKADLQQRIEVAYNVEGHHLVMGIYYTEYVTQ